jgi:hypothetical protein
MIFSWAISPINTGNVFPIDGKCRLLARVYRVKFAFGKVGLSSLAAGEMYWKLIKVLSSELPKEANPEQQPVSKKSLGTVRRLKWLCSWLKVSDCLLPSVMAKDNDTSRLIRYSLPGIIK